MRRAAATSRPARQRATLAAAALAWLAAACVTTSEPAESAGGVEALPFAAPGHLRGLTLQRLFDKVLAQGAPHLFMSSFNEHIGGRQAPVARSAGSGEKTATT